MAFSGGNQVAILLSQRMVDRNKPRAIDVDRRKLVAQLLETAASLLVISGHRLADL